MPSFEMAAVVVVVPLGRSECFLRLPDLLHLPPLPPPTFEPRQQTLPSAVAAAAATVAVEAAAADFGAEFFELPLREPADSESCWASFAAAAVVVDCC